MNLSQYLEEELIKHTLGLGTYVNASPLYVALLSDLADDGTSRTELTGSNYARQELQPSDLSAPSDGACQNDVDIVWPAALADWGTVRYIGVFDSAVAGNLLWWGELDVAKFIAVSAVYKILAGDMTFRLAGAFSLYLRDNILDFVLRDGVLVSPSSVYAGLGTGTSSLNESISEPTGGYARILINTFVKIANGRYQIDDPELSFTADSDWGSMTHLGIWDSSSSGNLLYALSLSPSRDIYDGDGLLFRTNAVTLTVT